MNRYATLDQTLQELSNEADVDTSAPDTKEYVWQALAFVSERIDQITKDEFAPRVDTRYFNARGRHILSASTIDVVDGQPKDGIRSPLLEVTTITLDGVVLGGSDYQANPRGVTPIRRITMTTDDSWLAYDGMWQSAHTIAGVWGSRRRYATEGWRNSGDKVQNSPLTANGTTINVNDADALTGVYALPRFQAGQLLRIGTGTDFRTVETVTGGVTNTLSVLPNANGSTSTEQAQNAAIYIWEPEPVIQRAALKWAQHLFSRRGTTTSSTYDGAAGIKIDFPPDAPLEVMNILVEGGYLSASCLPKESYRGNRA